MIAVNFILPEHWRNYWFLIASLFFYTWREPSFVWIMISSITINYFFAILIERSNKNSHCKKLLLVLSILLNIGILFVYKYLNFVIYNLMACWPNSGLVQTSFVLPIGISFFTFQARSYVIDVYRGGGPAQKNPFYLALYISFFPQLVAGPIVRYVTIVEEIKSRKTSWKLFSTGMMRFVVGFNKKMILSNLLAEVVDCAFSISPLSFGLAWLGSICYTLQIFYDFSGYSDMAIGMGQIFGFHFLENFDYPYISKTITEFWRRWHISLGSWFRDYVYFPLGGSRVPSKIRLVFNLSIVWLTTGIWHGASWHFIVWGLLYGVMIIIEKLLLIPQKVQEKKSWGFYQIITLLAINFGWVLFRAESLAVAGNYLGTMLGINCKIYFDNNFIFYLRDYAIILAVSLLFATPIMNVIENKLLSQKALYVKTHKNALSFAHVFLFTVSVSFLAVNAHIPFIYFNF